MEPKYFIFTLSLAVGLALISQLFLYSQKMLWYRSANPSKNTLPTALTETSTPNSQTPSPNPPNPAPNGQKLSWGVYAGGQMQNFTDFENKVGQTPQYMATFVHWGNENQFPSKIAAIAKQKKATLVIFWEAMDYNAKSENDPRFSYQQIIVGKWDNYINSFITATKTFGQELILVPFEEMNSDWYPWSGTTNGNSPKLHQQAYRYLKNMFSGNPKVKFGWVVNNDSVPNTAENAISSYYPGDEFVDYLGIDGFNFGNPWQNFDQVFGQGLEKLSAYKKPIIIFSTASAPGAKKADWIRSIPKVLDSYPTVTGLIWFNENKEKDWRIWSDPLSLAAFKQVISTWPFANTPPTPSPPIPD